MHPFPALVYRARRHRVVQFAVTLSLLLLVAGTVSAGSYTAGPPVLASGLSPFAACTVGAMPQANPPSVNYVNTEVEPWVAVNPINANNIIAVYQQDRWSDGGAHGLVTAVSHDGGLTWSRTWAHFSLCAGGTVGNGGDFDRASDPWVTFAPNGDAYQISLSVSADLLTSAILVSKSSDGGDTWSEPATLMRERSAFNFNDKESITADPTNSNYVYAVWDRGNKPGENASFSALHSFAFRGTAMFARTTNGGTSWEAPRSIMPTNANLWTLGNQIAVLPNGTLVDVFSMAQGSGIQGSVNPFTESLLRSTDKGVTWSRVIDIATDQSVAVLDPDTGIEVRTGAGIPEIAVDAGTGNLYVVWEDSRFSGGAHNDIAFSMSTDGGLTWTAPVKVNKTTNNAAAFVPSVHVAADGTVGVTYYDFRNNTSATGVPTDYWLVHCHGSCTNPANWSETHIAGPFDIEIAPFARGYFLGDYEGLASIGSAFVPLFVQANTGDTSNRTDAFFTTVSP